jgi:hypothetical protein
MVLMSGVTAARALATDAGLLANPRIDLGTGIEPDDTPRVAARVRAGAGA